MTDSLFRIPVGSRQHSRGLPSVFVFFCLPISLFSWIDSGDIIQWNYKHSFYVILIFNYRKSDVYNPHWRDALGCMVARDQ